MKWLSGALLLRLLFSAPVCDALWEARVAALLEETGLGVEETSALRGADLRIDVSSGGTTARLDLGAGVDRPGLAIGWRGLFGRANDGAISMSSAVTVQAGGWEFGCGPARGGLGTGLMCDLRWRLRPGARVRSAWSGLPHGLTAVPIPPAAGITRLISLRRCDGRGPSLAWVREPGRPGAWLVSWERTAASRALLLLAPDRSGAEFALGRRRDGLALRISGAGWTGRGWRDGSERHEEAGGGAAAEIVASLRSRAAAWEASLWGWWGESPPLARPVGSATRERRQGVRGCVELRPPIALQAVLACEVARGGEGVGGLWWWRSEGTLLQGRPAGAGASLTFRSTTEREDRLWTGTLTESTATLDLRLRGRSDGRVRWRVGGRRSLAGGGAPALGAWLQIDFTGAAWNGYLRGSYSLPEPGVPLFWYEPAPVPGKNLRRAGEPGPSLVIGCGHASGRVGLRLLFDEGGRSGLLLRLRLHR